MTGQQTFYKAIREDGGSFNQPQFKWNTEPGGVTVHPTGTLTSGSDATHYLSVATVPTDCMGMAWPCRLLEVEPVGVSWTPDSESLPNKRAALAFRTIRELEPTFALGPQGAELDALIKRAKKVTPTEGSALHAARDAAGYAARALVVRDLITPGQFTREHYELLTKPWRTVIGPLHADDSA